MKSVLILLVGVVSLHLLAGTSRADLTLASFEENYLGGGSFTESLGPSPLPLAQIDSGNAFPGPTYGGSASYELTSHYSLEDSTTLKTHASAVVSGVTEDEEGTPIWSTIHASARATSDVVTFGTVQGTLGANTGGFISLNWIVTGISTLQAAPDNLVNVTATAFTKLTTPLSAQPLLEEMHATSNSPVTDFPASSNAQEVFVPWSVGEEVPIHFSLESLVTIDATNSAVSPAGFTAKSVAAFDNSAHLTSVVLDTSMMPIAGATFQISAVPEPSSFLFLGIVGVLVLANTVRRRS